MNNPVLLRQTEYLHGLFLLLHFIHNEMSSTKIKYFKMYTLRNVTESI